MWKTVFKKSYLIHSWIICPICFDFLSFHIIWTPLPQYSGNSTWRQRWSYVVRRCHQKTNKIQRCHDVVCQLGISFLVHQSIGYVCWTCSNRFLNHISVKTHLNIFKRYRNNTLTLSCMILKNGQTYFKNLAVFTTYRYSEMFFCHSN